MKKIFLIAMLSGICLSLQAITPWDKGGFETQQYRNIFVEMGYKPMAVEFKLRQVFDDVFRGPNKVYFEVGDTLGYISDIKNHDVRTEGMSYGMMIAVQMDEKDIFDRIWRWSKKYMQHQDGPRKGYFAWSCKTDGTHNAEGAASDGELYYVTALIFASNRWGNDTGINYLGEARNILDCSMAKTGEDGQMPLLHPEHQLITFTPDRFGSRNTDPSYHIPAFYEVWAKWAGDGRSDYWMEAARKSRAFLHKAIHPETGLNPDICQYDGTVNQGPWNRGGGNFRYDSWRVPMNIALDYEWSCADKEWQQNYGERIQNFFYSQGIDKYVDQYRVDGSLPAENEILVAGGFRKLRHSIGLMSTLAAASVLCSHDKSKEFVDALWNAKHEPFEDGYFDAYYDGLLRLFAFMHLSGHYRVIFPQTPLCVVRTGDLSMTIDADGGGKILSFKHNGKEILSQSRAPESFGSTFWTSPQKEWNWPPVPEFDKMPYTIEQKSPTLVMTSKVSEKLKFRVRKTFAAKDNAIAITYTIINEGDSTRRVAPWEISRVNNEGLVFFDADIKSIVPADLIPFNAQYGAVWHSADEARENRKINADGKGWLAYTNNGLLLIKTFNDLKAKKAAPGEAEIQVYVNRGKTYVELESQGAYTTLKPGQSLDWTVTWRMLPYDGPASPSAALLQMVKNAK